ncbi:hypothetical protein JQ571_29820 [Bradyrhizobium liaoningense]|nr:hypothetical protein [Bradyrhizobium liaoningense]MBR1171209.1 hypothetical protein [Bradyrhizobium liaoningense]
MTFADFLQSMPPGQSARITDAVERDQSAPRRFEITAPALWLHCTSDICNGPRIFRFLDGFRYYELDPEKGPSNRYFTYLCSNCRRKTKMFSLSVSPGKDANPPAAFCTKFGEIPAFGTPTPNRLLRLFGSDSKIFLKGRQCENHGLGIGAFSYYRRVVENHKDQLFSEIIKVAAKIAPDTVAALQAAKEQHQFLNALDAVKDVFPQGLLINGHNPLTLLHSALSEGLHAHTDEQCLQAAHDIRIVLAELTDRMGQALKNEAELTSAVARLTQRKSDRP